MRLTDIFIRRPVLATVVNLFLLIIGGLAIKAMVVRQYPQTNNAVIKVTTTYPGASADTMAVSVAAPLERQFATIEARCT